MNTLLYIVRNNFRVPEFEECSKSILGVFDSLEKAYKAGHKKIKEIKDIYSDEFPIHLELKVVKLNMSDYLGCSAFPINFANNYSDKEIAAIDSRIQEWDTWEYFELLKDCE